MQEYKKHVYVKNDAWKEYDYTKYDDWTKDESKDANSYGNKSVKEYGGFYIGRYEAGWNEGTETEIGAGSNYVDTLNDIVEKRNVTTKKPVSKKGVFSWNLISQDHAKTVSENMYKDNNLGVTSYLVDGTAWDTITHWIATDNVDVTRSSKYGNYDDTEIIYTGLYAKHIYAAHISPDTTNHWLYAKKFSKGTITLMTEQIQSPYSEGKTSDYAETDIENPQNHRFWRKYELPTGSYDGFKLKNIYDLAGNMWEWTTETGTQMATESGVADRRLVYYFSWW